VCDVLLDQTANELTTQNSNYLQLEDVSSDGERRFLFNLREISRIFAVGRVIILWFLPSAACFGLCWSVSWWNLNFYFFICIILWTLWSLWSSASCMHCRLSLGVFRKCLQFLSDTW